jgi:AcrR family transcriptional regulator
MARPNLSSARRDDLVAKVAATFAKLGYRRTTTAALAERCGVQETVLYRLWPDKRAMFVAAIEFVGSNSERIWQNAVAGGTGARTAAERILEHEATHLGEFGLYRILFAGLSETDDAKITRALRRVYRQFLGFIGAQVQEHRRARRAASLPDARWTAWALVGLGTAVNIGRELGLLGSRPRRELFAAVGRRLLG